MVILGIETSCDETAVAVIEAEGDSIRIRSSIVSSQVALHERWGGVVPSLAAREHTVALTPVTETAFLDAGITDPAQEIDLIAVTNGPGLGPALLTGLTFARTLSWKWSKPLIGVNHLDGHIHSNWLPPIRGMPNDKFQMTNELFPAMNLIVSGGHTELVLMQGHGDYQIIGETQDDAVGEAFDKVARLLELGYPGGPKISKLAESGDPAAYDLPRPMVKSGDLNFSYSGLKTAVLYLIRDITEGARELTTKEKADIAASFQEAAIAVLIGKTRDAIEQYAPASLLLSGGVSANRLLRERIEALGAERKLPTNIPELQWTGDNAAMIAAAGYFAFLKNSGASWDGVAMDANLRLGHNQ
jgi:N6-L-threonylcarbamoyladenine synthase